MYCWDEYLSFLDYELYQDRIWVVGRKTPGIFSIDRQLSDVKLEYNLVPNRKEPPYRKDLAVRIRQNEMYVFREDRPCVEKINMETGEETEFIFEMSASGSPYTVQDIYEYKGIYFIIPASAGASLLSFDGQELSECLGWKEQMAEIAGNKGRHWLDACTYRENELWFVVPDTNLLVRTELDSFTVTAWNIGGDSCRLEMAAYDGEKFWLVGSRQEVIYQWSEEKGLEKVYDNFPSRRILGTKDSFVKIVFYKDSVWFIPGSASEILILDKQTGECCGLELPELIWLKDDDRQQSEKFHAVLQQEDKLILFSCCTRQHIVIDMEKKRIVRKADTRIKKEDLSKVRMRFLMLYNTCTSDVCGFSDFMAFVKYRYKISLKEKEYYTQGDENVKGSGERIWEEIKSGSFS